VAESDDWAPEVAEIQRRHTAAAGMGGPDKVARQHATGRLTARERIALLADAGSFREIGSLTGFGDYDGDGKLTALRTAERFGVQDLIDPRDSRVLLCEWIRDAYRLLPGLTGRPSFGTRP
jgi:hypothetical protein